ncbi:MAG: hypothetical protein WBS18_00100 [Candidatus Acidiferrales bacterium]
MNHPAWIRRSRYFCAKGLFLALSVFFAFASLAAAAPARAESGPDTGATITFRKVFKSSYPEFVEIKLSESGSGTWDIRALDEEPSPQPFQIGQPLTQKIYDLAGRLHDFAGVDLEIHRRIASLGEKTFRYEKNGQTHEVTFNYTLDPSGAELLDIFEGLARQELDLSDLQRTMRYDRLGVNDVLVRIDADYTEKLLPESDSFLPVLDQIAADDKLIDMARQRARNLAARIRASH